jgi:hypothetical protein
VRIDVFQVTTPIDVITGLEVTVRMCATGLMWAIQSIGEIYTAGRLARTDDFALDLRGDAVGPGQTGRRVGRRRRLPDQH